MLPKPEHEHIFLIVGGFAGINLIKAIRKTPYHILSL